MYGPRSSYSPVDLDRWDRQVKLNRRMKDLAEDLRNASPELLQALTEAVRKAHQMEVGKLGKEKAR